MPVPVVAVLSLLLSTSAAHAVGVLTVGKHAVLRAESGFVRVGRDPLLAALAEPCPGGVEPRLTLSSYPQSTLRVVTHLDVALPCAGWTPLRSGGWRYDGGAPGDGVERVDLRPDKLVVQLGGDGYQAPSGPVGYVQVWLTVGGQRLNARFHNFKKNQAALLATRKPSAAAAEGEAAFWAVLHRDDPSEARQQACLAALGKAVRRDRKDGRARFLLGMMRLYRFGQSVDGYVGVDPAAEADLARAVEEFDAATPMLWNAGTSVGDSRVPGFAAAARYGLGRVRGDAALEARGLDELEAAVDVNPFFNLFDLIPVAQAVGPADPQFALVMSRVTTYLADPANLSCVVTQPEICANDGMAPRNVEGALTLFGDLYVKAAGAAATPAERDQNVALARQWYGIASAFASSRPGYRFQAELDERVASIDARVAAYQSPDPGDDPAVIGAREEACTACHNR